MRGRPVNQVGRIPSRSHGRDVASFILVGSAFAAINFWAADALNWSCPLRTSTGILCPACGASHALQALTRGDILLAVESNALLVMALVSTMIAIVAWRFVRLRITADVLSYLVLGALAGFMLLRNLAPFWFLRVA